MYRRLPPFGGDQRAVAEIVNNIMDGKTNNTGSVTLATGNATSTTITDARIGVDSVILLVPKSAAAFADTGWPDPISLVGGSGWLAVCLGYARARCHPTRNQ